LICCEKLAICTARVNLVPFPISDSNYIWQFILSHSDLHKYNPKPVPDLLIPFVSLSIPNAENNFPLFSADIPIPVSIT